MNNTIGENTYMVKSSDHKGKLSEVRLKKIYTMKIKLWTLL